jgi:hypothetical protein
MTMSRIWRFVQIALFAVLLFVGTSKVAYTQLLTPDSELPLLVGARGASLAEANSADITDVSVLYWNPGALGFLKKVSAVFDEYYEMRTAINNDMVAVAIPHISDGTLAIGAGISDIGYIKQVHPYDFQAIAYGFDIGYGAVFSQGFSAGFRMHGQLGHQANSNIFTNYWSFGVVYNPSTEISYGLSCTGLGQGLFLADSVSMVKESMSRRLEIGVAMHYPASHDRQFLTISVANEKVFGESGLYYKTGVEILPLNYVALRFGYSFGPVVSAPRFGVGLKTDYIRLDYAIAPSYASTRFQQVTLSINL